MKKDIHPNYVEMQVACACGNKFKTRGYKNELRVEICNVCHPFFTGKMKVLDSEGRVERFNKRYGRK